MREKRQRLRLLAPAEVVEAAKTEGASPIVTVAVGRDVARRVRLATPYAML